MLEIFFPKIKLIDPVKAFELFKQKNLLIDVRTKAERDLVGYVPGSYHIEWTQYPAGTLNPHFIDELILCCSNKNHPLLFLCRSGVRSQYAAASALKEGYTECYNIVEGFEGEVDPDTAQRTLNGWKVRGLPWTY